ncbi:hypothetical protein TNCV_4846791 [Trichonephila clavipes]|nr:hypothetical protein TNCV_4846791 [Trichonephila clavipes]
MATGSYMTPIYSRSQIKTKLICKQHSEETHPGFQHRIGENRRLISGVWTVNSPQSHIVRVYDAGHGKSGVFHSAEWHDGDWSSDGIREAWLWFFIWVESF